MSGTTTQDLWMMEAHRINKSEHQPMVERLANEDGRPHFAFFDKDRHLSFVWSGDYDDMVQISWDGYGEPVLWLLNMRMMWTLLGAPEAIVGPMTSLRSFQRVCRFWAEAKEEILEP